MTLRSLIFCCVLLAPLCALAEKERNASLDLAIQLHSEELHDLAALEFRRCSLLTASVDDDGRGEQSGFLTAAAWEYIRTDRLDLALKMLDEAEDASPKARNSALLIRGEISMRQRRFEESEFLLSTLADSDAPDEYRTAAKSRMAIATLKQHDLPRTRSLLMAISSKDALQHLDHLESTRGRSPRVGGLLGMLPGMGYAYSGEYANCLRSIILNGIFIYGMVETADNDQWGAFTALSFFELTWYTGSIYGGIDAAHRFNKRREESLETAIRSEYGYDLDLSAIPSITLEFSF